MGILDLLWEMPLNLREDGGCVPLTLSHLPESEIVSLNSAGLSSYQASAWSLWSPDFGSIGNQEGVSVVLLWRRNTSLVPGKVYGLGAT